MMIAPQRNDESPVAVLAEPERDGHELDEPALGCQP
jgi:hypothetical protein